jgi:hypothetical protein
MTSIGEAGDVQGQMLGTLQAGRDSLDLDQEVTFNKYSRVVLPLDGYVFWAPGAPFVAKGALHYSQEVVQSEDETQGYATLTFTARDPIVEFTAAPSNTLYVATVDGFRYSFSQQQGFFQQAALWHYFGHSIPPALAAQLVDKPGSIDPDRAVVSNSLPLWLAMNNYVSPFYDGFSDAGVPFVTAPPTLYPSFLVEDNKVPPYGAVHIGEDDTRALQAAPLLDRNRSHSQLVSDRVRITLYGLQNDEAMDFLDTINQYSLLTDSFGIMNSPVVRDGKRKQEELKAVAMKKVIDLEISYYQTRAAAVARQLILSSIPSFFLKS